jgi:hypothetical protein
VRKAKQFVRVVEPIERHRKAQKSPAGHVLDRDRHLRFGLQLFQPAVEQKMIERPAVKPGKEQPETPVQEPLPPDNHIAHPEREMHHDRGHTQGLSDADRRLQIGQLPSWPSRDELKGAVQGCDRQIVRLREAM